MNEKIKEKNNLTFTFGVAPYFNGVNRKRKLL